MLNPAWNEPQSPEILNACFAKAMELTGIEFLERLLGIVNTWWPARTIVENALANRLELHPSGKIILFEQCCPWKEHLFEIEKQVLVPPPLPLIPQITPLKQARKTGTSSPLGMLFDHGIDAINCVLLTLPVCSALGTGMSTELLIIMSIGFIPFITQGWEEYYREEMVLPLINGPTEGLLVTMGMLIYSSMYGAESFHVVRHLYFETNSAQ